MRLPYLPAPIREVEAGRRIHELVRDFPEVAPVLERVIGPLATVGWRRVEECLPPSPEGWEALEKAMAWRGTT